MWSKVKVCIVIQKLGLVGISIGIWWNATIVLRLYNMPNNADWIECMEYVRECMLGF